MNIICMCVWILSVVTKLNLTRQMVCYTEPSEKLSLETVWKRTGTFKKYLASDKMHHPSITVYHGLTSTNQINEPYDIEEQRQNRGNSTTSGTLRNIEN